MRTQELTDLEKQKLEEYYNEYLAIGLCTDPADRPRAEAAITQMYALLDLGPPEFQWYDSPDAAVEALEAAGVSSIDTFLWGQHDAYWVAYYKYARDVLGAVYEEADSRLLDLWDEIARSCMWWWPFERVCLISERPCVCQMNDNGLHRDGGPALDFRDGKSRLFMLNGVTMPEEIVMTPAEKLDPAMLKTIDNAQVRAEFIRKVGAERVVKKLSKGAAHRYGLFHHGGKAYLEIFVHGKPKESKFVEVPLEHVRPQPGREPAEGAADFERCVTINQALYACSMAAGKKGLASLPAADVPLEHGAEPLDAYELHQLDFGDGDPARPYLLMYNPSVPDLMHAERVPREATTIEEALRFRNNLQPGQIDPENGADWHQQGDVLLFPEKEKKFKPFPVVLT